MHPQRSVLEGPPRVRLEGEPKVGARDDDAHGGDRQRVEIGLGRRKDDEREVRCDHREPDRLDDPA